MAQKYIAVEGMILEFVNPSHTGTITITGIPSQKVEINNKKVYLDNLTISISNGSNGSITNATGVGFIKATSTKVVSLNQKVLREGDETLEIIMTGTNPSPPPPTSTYTTKVKISNANQNVVQCE